MWACFGVGAKGQQRILHSSYILPTQTTAWICVPNSHALWVVKCFSFSCRKVTQNFSSLTVFIQFKPFADGLFKWKGWACLFYAGIGSGWASTYLKMMTSIIFKCQQLNTRNPGVVRVGQSLGFLTWSESTNTHRTQTNNRKKWMP